MKYTSSRSFPFGRSLDDLEIGRRLVLVGLDGAGGPGPVEVSDGDPADPAVLLSGWQADLFLEALHGLGGAGPVLVGRVGAGETELRQSLAQFADRSPRSARLEHSITVEKHLSSSWSPLMIGNDSPCPSSRLSKRSCTRDFRWTSKATAITGAGLGPDGPWRRVAPRRRPPHLRYDRPHDSYGSTPRCSAQAPQPGCVRRAAGVATSHRWVRSVAAVHPGRHFVAQDEVFDVLGRGAALTHEHRDDASGEPARGAVIAPPVPAFYTRPASLADMVDHTVGRVFDLDLDLGVSSRWPGHRPAVLTTAPAAP